MLLPSYDIMFYRPLSRELYFLILKTLGGANAFLGHLLNTVVLAAAACLLVLVASDLIGRRAGLLAGLGFATFGQIPFLVGFVSGMQDLLAIALFLLAFRFELRSKPAAALTCFALSLLAKETIVALAPILVLVPWLRGNSGRLRMISAIGYVSILLGWLVIHPAIRMLVNRWLEPRSNPYVGVYPGAALRKAGPSLLALFNLPPSGTAPWPAELTTAFLAAMALLIAGLWFASRTPLPKTKKPTTTAPQVAVIGSAMVLLPGAATLVFLRQWSPYYLCAPAMGLSLLAGLALRARGWLLSAIVTALWLSAGVWSRGDPSGPTMSTEKNFAIAGQELKTVERGFRKLRPAFPRDSRIYVSVMARGLGNVDNALHRYQCLRAWYQDPSLRAGDPVTSMPGHGPEFLFVVRQDLIVDEVIFDRASPGDSLEIRIALGAPSSDYRALVLAIRNRALGQAAGGDVKGGAQLLLSMPVPSRGFRIYDWRLAATLLLAHGDTTQVQAILDQSPFQSRGDPADYLYTYLIHTSGPGMDEAAFRCFGVSQRDAELLRSLMRRLEASGNVNGALRCARRLLHVIPTDREGREAAVRLERIPISDRVTRRADETDRCLPGK